MSESRIKIAFSPWPTAGWPAGSIFLRDLWSALREHGGAEVTTALWVHPSAQEVLAEWSDLAQEIVPYPVTRKGTLAWWQDVGAKHVLRRDWIAGRSLRAHGIDLLVMARAPSGAGLPALTWIADRQHFHMPEMFSAAERQARDREQLDTLEHFDCVIVWSEAVRRDLAAFAPQESDKVRMLTPVCNIPDATYHNDVQSLVRHYQLPDRFVYLPNQFWAHKNHRVAFQAQKILKDRGVPVFLVCSGYPWDYRKPAHFSDLLRELSEWGLREQTALLGAIPREHVLSLMRQAICVLNPSLFEGFGLTVDEARGLGKRLVLSDIPAHREQDPPGALYFDPLCPDELADLLSRVWRETAPGPDRPREAEGKASLIERRRHYAQGFMRLARELVGSERKA